MHANAHNGRFARTNKRNTHLTHAISRRQTFGQLFIMFERQASYKQTQTQLQTHVSCLLPLDSAFYFYVWMV